MGSTTNQKTGFTIVELLIVIVVIAILVAISVVVFSGIRDRAENTRTSAAISGLIKSLKAYKAATGKDPGDTAYAGELFDGGCLNDPGVQCGISGGDSCFTTFFPLSGGPYSSAFTPKNEFANLVQSLPTTSPQKMRCNAAGDTASGATVMTISATLNGETTHSLLVTFFLKGDVPCPSYEGVAQILREHAYDATRCYLTI